jgi:hypothetical protein
VLVSHLGVGLLRVLLRLRIGKVGPRGREKLLCRKSNATPIIIDRSVCERAGAWRPSRGPWSLFEGRTHSSGPGCFFTVRRRRQVPRLLALLPSCLASVVFGLELTEGNARCGADRGTTSWNPWSPPWNP